MFSVSRHSLIQWVLLLVLGGVLLAWRLSERSISRHRSESMTISETSLRRPADTFVALRYAVPGPSSEKQDEDLAGSLSEHMKMLHREGYNTIRLADVVDFYRGGRLLPEKSVLVTFDDAAGNVFRMATETLEEMSVPAVTFMTFGTRMRGERILLPWHNFRTAYRSGYWEMGSTGLRSSRYVTIDEKGALGHFLSNRRWLRGEDRLETEQEYKRRIRRDVREGAGILESRIGGLQVRAFAYPFSDYGQGSTNLNDAEGPIRAAVRDRYALAFRHNGYGWNYEETDPFVLNRMTVNFFMNPTEVLRRLEASAPREGGVLGGFDSSRLPDGWQLETGECACRDGRLVLSPVSGQAGGQLWLSGTEKWHSCMVEVTFEASSDEQRWLYLRHRDKGNFVRVGGMGNDLYVQQKVGEEELRSLAKFTGIFEPNAAHRLLVSLMGHRVQLSCDELALETRSIEIADRLSTGKIGLGMVTQKPGQGSVSFSGFRAEETRSVLILARDLGSADSLEQVAGMLPGAEILSPFWFSISASTGPLTSTIDNQDLVRMLASYHNLRLIPTVLCDSVGIERDGAFRDPSKQEDLAETLIALAAELSLDGYLFWLDGEGALPGGQTLAEETGYFVPEWIRSLRESFRSENLRLALGMRFENARQLGRELPRVLQVADILVARVESDEGCDDPAWVGSPQTRTWTVSRTHLFMACPLNESGDHETLDARFAGIGKAVLVGNHERNNHVKEPQEETSAFQ